LEHCGKYSPFLLANFSPFYFTVHMNLAPTRKKNNQGFRPSYSFTVIIK
jgi:hypothetical protein